MIDSNNKLKRNLSLTLVTFYGLGNILGAGIYVLVGEVAGEAGYQAPLSFFLASLIALITALSFAELTSRYPVSGGGAVYIHKGFDRKQLSRLTGILIIFTGIVSAATMARGFVGYLQIFVNMPGWLAIIVFCTMLGLLAIWGVVESVRVAAIFTLLELFGLLLIVYAAAPYYAELPQKLIDFQPSFEPAFWPGILSGAFLAFYAYIGFEDMVNMAEEVKNPQRNLPLAILISLAVAALLYIVVTISALLVLTPPELEAAAAPLAAVYETSTQRNPWVISLIGLFAVANGALIQIIMASRVCFGMAREQWLPQFFGRVWIKTQTPGNATIAMAAMVVVMALWLPLETLARSTSFVLLMIFALVHLSLWRIKLADRGGSRDRGHEDEKNLDFPSPQVAVKLFQVPLMVPIMGVISCLLFLSSEIIALVN